MQQKQIIWLLGVLVVLVLIAWASGTFDSAPSTIEVPNFTLDLESIDRIEIDRTDLHVVLDRTTGRWEVVDPVSALADSITVAALVRNLGELEVESVVSTNPDRYAHYGVDSTGSTLVIRAGDDTHRFVISTQGPDYSSGYLLVDTDERVFVGIPRISIAGTLDRWRDKRIFSITSQAVLNVAVTTPEHSFILQKDASGWQISSDETQTTADSSAVSRWLRNFSPLRADGFLEELPEASTVTHSAVFRLSDGSFYSLDLTPGELEVAATYSGTQNVVYKLNSSRTGTLFPDPSTLY